MGVVKALLDNNALPIIISGTSAGSLIAACICVRTDKELYEELLVPDWYKNLTACQSTFKVSSHFD